MMSTFWKGASITALAVVVGVSVCGCNNEQPKAKVVAKMKPLPDQLELTNSGALRKQHGGEGDARKQVKMQADPRADGTMAYTYFSDANKVTKTEEFYGRPSAEDEPRLKSRALFDQAGKILEGIVHRPDRSKFLEMRQLPGGAKETKFYTPSIDGKPGFHFATRVMRTLPVEKQDAKAAKDADLMPYADDLMDLPVPPPAPPTTAKPPAPQAEQLPAPKEVKVQGAKRIETTYFRPNGTRWGSETAVLKQGSTNWEKSALSLYRDGDVNSLEWEVDENFGMFVLTHYRSDGKTKDYVARWSNMRPDPRMMRGLPPGMTMAQMRQMMGMSTTLQQVEEYDIAGKLSRTIHFNDSGSRLVVASIKTESDGRVVHFNTLFTVVGAGTLIEDHGSQKVWNQQTKTYTTVENKRFLVVGSVSSVAKVVSGKEVSQKLEPGRNDKFWPVDVRMVRTPLETPFWQEFTNVREKSDGEDLSFLGQPLPNDVTRWYFGKDGPDDDGGEDYDD
jgi:hypothetical protein